MSLGRLHSGSVLVTEFNYEKFTKLYYLESVWPEASKKLNIPKS